MCDICHNADRLLKYNNKWSKSEKAILEAYRRQHINQQFEERVKLEQNIADTHQLDINGQPEKVLLFADGMTIFTGESRI